MTMIEREITGRLTALFEQYPFVTVTGPRQSGKTTLCRAAFPNLKYVNLEAPDQRDFAESDPRGFLAQLGEGAIIDEVQHVPALLSYLQVLADELGRNGLFVLTGSEQFRLSEAISQSLAGRTALLRLLPFYANIRKRLVKSPKFYFYDVGLASYLIGLENADQVTTHPLRGALFENMVVVEALKHRFNRGRQPNLSFFRDSRGLECDLFYETGRGIHAIEVKSGATVSSDYFVSLNRVAELVPNISAKTVVYGGAARQIRSDCEVMPLGELAGALERTEAHRAS